MRYSTFGRTGLFVSELCFGAMTFGGKGGIWEKIGNTAQQEADRLVGLALDAGINFFDTADVYSEGDSERPQMTLDRLSCEPCKVSRCALCLALAGNGVAIPRARRTQDGLVRE